MTKRPRELRLLAFDFGTKHTGVASGQSITGAAEPVGTLAMKAGKPRWRDVTALVDSWQPNQLVVGLPLNMDGTEATVAPAAKQFAEDLGRRYAIPVALEDERLSTRAIADQIKPQDPRSHALAACVIAEQYLRRPR